MILADTSIWVDYLGQGDADMATLLDDGQIAIHPFVIGELACGNCSNRTEVLSQLHKLPMVPVADQIEVLFFIEQRRLMGLGVGYVDVHLLVGVSLMPPTRLWTRDKRLRKAAASLGLACHVN